MVSGTLCPKSMPVGPPRSASIGGTASTVHIQKQLRKSSLSDCIGRFSPVTFFVQLNDRPARNWTFARFFGNLGQTQS